MRAGLLLLILAQTGIGAGAGAALAGCVAVGGVASGAMDMAAAGISCAGPAPMAAHALRLPPDTELKSSLMAYGRTRPMTVLSCVGSVKSARIRLASATADNKNKVAEYDQRFEIVSLVGTLSGDGAHLHISLADEEGRVVGGHLLSATIFTTAELVLGELQGISFTREMDPRTGFPELCVRPAEEGGKSGKKGKKKQTRGKPPTKGPVEGQPRILLQWAGHPVVMDSGRVGGLGKKIQKPGRRRDAKGPQVWGAQKTGMKGGKVKETAPQKKAGGAPQKKAGGPARLAKGGKVLVGGGVRKNKRWR